jgi:hypothetical protein
VTLWLDLQRGWNADVASIIRGALYALAISVPLILILTLATALPDALAALIGIAVQLVAGYIIAGRLARASGGRGAP